MSSPTCRYCLDDEGPLVAPCNCKGTQAHIHEACLLQWQKDSCELCKVNYQFKQRLTLASLGALFLCVALWSSQTAIGLVGLWAAGSAMGLGFAMGAVDFVLSVQERSAKKIAANGVCLFFTLFGINASLFHVNEFILPVGQLSVLVLLVALVARDLSRNKRLAGHRGLQSEENGTAAHAQ